MSRIVSECGNSAAEVRFVRADDLRHGALNGRGPKRQRSEWLRDEACAADVVVVNTGRGPGDNRRASRERRGDASRPRRGDASPRCRGDVAAGTCRSRAGAHFHDVAKFEDHLGGFFADVDRVCDASKPLVLFRTTPEGNPLCASHANVRDERDWEDTVWAVINGSKSLPADSPRYSKTWAWEKFQTFNAVAERLAGPCFAARIEKDGSRRRRGRDANIAQTGRGGAAAAT